MSNIKPKIRLASRGPFLVVLIIRTSLQNLPLRPLVVPLTSVVGYRRRPGLTVKRGQSGRIVRVMTIVRTRDWFQKLLFGRRLLARSLLLRVVPR